MSLIGISGRIGSGKDTFALMLKAAIARAKTPESWKDVGEGFNELDLAACQQNDGNTLDRMSGYQTKRFAGALKQIVAILIGCTVEQLENREFKEMSLGPEWDIEADYGKYDWLNERMTLTPRIILQLLGTNCVRNIIHPNAWVNALFAQYKSDLSIDQKIDRDFGGKQFDKYEEKLPNWIITDTRFPNEAEAIKQRSGLLIRLERELLVVPKIPTNNEETDQIYSMLNHPSETALDGYDFDIVVPNNGTLEELYEHAKQIVQKYKLHL